MAAKLTRLIHKIAIQLYLITEICTICNSRSRRPVRKLLDTASYIHETEVEPETYDAEVTIALNVTSSIRYRCCILLLQGNYSHAFLLMKQS
jgi:hypothetical protein